MKYIKECLKCHDQKDSSEFAKNSSRKDGFDSYCKDCRKKIRADHYQKNKDKHKDRVKNWREKKSNKETKQK